MSEVDIVSVFLAILSAIIIWHQGRIIRRLEKTIRIMDGVIDHERKMNNMLRRENDEINSASYWNGYDDGVKDAQSSRK